MFNLQSKLALLVIVVCPFLGVFAAFDRGHVSRHFVTRASGLAPDDRIPHHHHDQNEKPCDVCPRNGRCVPHVQCPAHLRSNSHNPACHLSKSGQLGICCTTGQSHASENDLKQRSATAISTDVVKLAHARSKQRLSEMEEREARIIKSGHLGTLLKKSSPSYGHYMSLRTADNERAAVIGRGALQNLFAVQELKQRQAVSDDAIQLGLTQSTDSPFCPPPPQCSQNLGPYRTIDGACNNPVNTAWGSVNTAYERMVPPEYSDGIWSLRLASNGSPLPSPRVVSDNILMDVDNPSQKLNLMFMQFGQFLAHDTSNAVTFRLGNGSAISCCEAEGLDFLPSELQHFSCSAIQVDPSDQFFNQFGTKCLNFVRTQLAPSHDCSLGYARQMNGVTHFADLSHIYGSTNEKLSTLRELNGGRLKMFQDFGRELPPLTHKADECLIAHEGAACFDSGDEHANQMISLVGLHTVWAREHNRIAQALARLNPEWTEDTLFFEARRLAQAEYQHILYNEWLPLVIGPQLAATFQLLPTAQYSTGYSSEVNPSLTTEFATAALRFGHSVVDRTLRIPTAQGGDYEEVSIPELMFQPSRLRLKPFLDRMLNGLTRQPMQNVDPFFTESLTRYMFHAGNPFGLDLASINVQRARDHGVKSYNQYRRLAGAKPVADFAQFSPKAAQRLATVYSSPDDVDLWIGGLLEEPIEGGVVGLTFANIIADQFSRLKRGDRYFYDYGTDVNPGAFSPSQLAEIKKVTMARLICDNSDGIELFSQPPNAFVRGDVFGNEPVPCDSPSIPRLDLSRFRLI